MPSATPTPRLAAARRRASLAKRGAVATAAAAFVAALLLARASHPGQGAPLSPSQDGSQAKGTTQTQDQFDFGSGSIAPSNGGTPQAQTNVS
jgi:hypothetical protein